MGPWVEFAAKSGAGSFRRGSDVATAGAASDIMVLPPSYRDERGSVAGNYSGGAPARVKTRAVRSRRSAGIRHIRAIRGLFASSSLTPRSLPHDEPPRREVDRQLGPAEHGEA